MNSDFMQVYRQHEFDSVAMSVQLNRWSLVMIQQMIRELEKKLMAINLPVDEVGKSERWWEDIA